MFLDPSSFSDYWYIFPNTIILLIALPLLLWATYTFSRHLSIVFRCAGLIAPSSNMVKYTGPQWTALFIIVFALIQGKAGLANGFLVGSAVADMLGVHSLLVLLGRATQRPAAMHSRTLTAILTMGIAGMILLTKIVTTSFARRVLGVLLIVGYIAYILWTVWSTSQSEIATPTRHATPTAGSGLTTNDIGTAPLSAAALPVRSPSPSEPPESQPLLQPSSISTDVSLSESAAPEVRLISAHAYPVLMLLVGCLIALAAAPTITATSALLAHCSCISDELFSTTILAPAVVLSVAIPFLLLMVGHLAGAKSGEEKDYGGALAAGENAVHERVLFLLTLCLGIVSVASEDTAKIDVKSDELHVLLCSSAAMSLLSTWRGFGTWSCAGRRVLALVMLAGYVAFLMQEYAVIRKGDVYHPPPESQ